MEFKKVYLQLLHWPLTIRLLASGEYSRHEPKVKIIKSIFIKKKPLECNMPLPVQQLPETLNILTKGLVPLNPFVPNASFLYLTVF